MTEVNENELREAKPQQVVAPRGSSLGCLFYGCLFSFLFMLLLMVGGGLASYWFLKGQLERYTSATPAELPTVEYTEEELAEIQNKVETFKAALKQDETPEDLVLTADEINSLIAEEEELRGRVFVTIDEGQVAGEVSIPTDFIPGGKGRYFNASATFDVSLDNGVLIVTLAAAEVNGQKVPQQFIDGLSQENLAKDMYKDPEVATMLRRFESLMIEEDKIILKPHVESKDVESKDTQQPASEDAEQGKSQEAGSQPG